MTSDTDKVIWLRTAATEDAEAIHAIMQEAWHDAYDDLIGAQAVADIAADWYDPVQLRQDIHQPSGEYIVADDGDALCGVAYGVSGSLPEAPETVVIRQLCVRIFQRKKGIGTQLLNELESCFPAARRFRVMVIEKNESALHFFARRGYERLEADKQAADSAHLFEVILEKGM